MLVPGGRPCKDADRYGNKDGIRLNMREARLRLGLSQKDLGARVYINYGHICHIESGVANLTLQTAVQIASVLNIEDIKILMERFYYVEENGKGLYIGEYGTRLVVIDDNNTDQQYY